MRLALYYKTEAYSTTMNRLMGRNVAGSTFLDSLLEFGNLDELRLFVDDQTTHADAIKLQTRLSTSLKVKISDVKTFNEIANSGQFFIPGPNIGQFCSRRSFVGHSKWSTIGITHTTSSIRVDQ